MDHILCPRCLGREGGCQFCNVELRNAVHGSHCCSIHGCKYGDGADCPVENGTIEQEGPDEWCYEIAMEWPTSPMGKLLASLRAEQSRIWAKNHNGGTIEHYSPEERSGRADGIDFAIEEIETKYKPKWVDRVLGVDA